MKRAKVNRRFWNRLHSRLHPTSPVFQIVQQEIRRIRVDSHSRGFEEGAEYMRQRLSGSYNA